MDPDRALRAYTDVLAVEWDADAGVARIVTLTDVYTAVPDEGMHLCPDREYHDPEDGMCKHLVALETVRGTFDAPVGWFTTDDLDDRTDPEFPVSADSPEAVADGGQTRPENCDCDSFQTDIACAACAIAGHTTKAEESA